MTLIDVAYSIIIKVICVLTFQILKIKESNMLNPRNEKVISKTHNTESAGLEWLMEYMHKLPAKDLEGIKLPAISVWNKGAPKCIYIMNKGKLLKIAGINMCKWIIMRYFMRKKVKSKSIYKAILRSNTNDKEEPDVHLLTEERLADLFLRWSMDKLRTIKYLSTYIDPSGLNPYVVTIQYKHDSKPRDSMNSDDAKFRRAKCYKITKKLAMTIENQFNLTILEMTIEFITSQTEYYINNAHSINYLAHKSVLHHIERPKICPSKSTKYIYDPLKNKRCSLELIRDVYTIMGKQYDSMKEDIDLKSALMPNPPNPHSNKAFKQIKPNSRFEFSDLLDPNFNPKTKIDKRVFDNYEGLSKKEIVKSLIEGNVKSIKKVNITKRMYGVLVKGASRVVHHIVPNVFSSYRQYDKSIEKIKNLADNEPPFIPRKSIINKNEPIIDKKLFKKNKSQPNIVISFLL